MKIHWLSAVILSLVTVGGCAAATDADDALEPTDTAEQPLVSDLQRASYALLVNEHCKLDAENWLRSATDAMSVTDDDCASAWNSFPFTLGLLDSQYGNILSKCSASLSLATKAEMTMRRLNLENAAEKCHVARECHEAVDALSEATTALDGILAGGCVHPDYWALHWGAVGLWADAYKACDVGDDFMDRDLLESVSDEIAAAMDQWEESSECSSTEYTVNRCHLVSVETVVDKQKQFGGWSKEITVEVRTYACPSTWDVAFCRSIHPTSVRVEEHTYLVYADKDVEVITNSCVLDTN